MKLKLNFHISRKSNLETPIIIYRVLSKLNDQNYFIDTVTDNRVIFDDEPWKLIWNFQSVRRLDGGEFEINTSANGTITSFNYHLNILSPLLMLAALTVFFLIQGMYEGILFFCAFYLIAIAAHIITLKSVARRMLEEIFNEDPPHPSEIG